VDADTGQIIAAELTSKDVDDGSQVGLVAGERTVSDIAIAGQRGKIRKLFRSHGRAVLPSFSGGTRALIAVRTPVTERPPG
jgi:hypothetical protein